MPRASLIFQQYCVDFGDCGDVEFSLAEFSREDAEVQLDLGLQPAETSKALVVAHETVARMRNMYIRCLHVSCVECAAQFIALWRDTYDVGRPCTVSRASLRAECPLTIDLKALLQPFMFSSLGVTSYGIFGWYRWDDGDMPARFEALWAAWDRRTVQILELYLDCPEMFTCLVDRMVVEGAHEVEHYLLSAEGVEPQAIVDSYVKVCPLFIWQRRRWRRHSLKRIEMDS